MIFTPFQIWFGHSGFWGLSIVRLETDWHDWSILSVGKNSSGWEFDVLGIKVLS